MALVGAAPDQAITAVCGSSFFSSSAVAAAGTMTAVAVDANTFQSLTKHGDRQCSVPFLKYIGGIQNGRKLDES